MGTFDKSSLRAECVRVRESREPLAIADARHAVRRAVLERCAIEKWTSVAAYLPMRTEPGSIELLDDLVNAGVRVIIPVLLPDRDLDWQTWGVHDAPALGVDAVAEVDAVLVPALAVAADGTRLGRGGGSYDRALARVANGTTIAAMVFEGETPAQLPVDGWDVPVSAVVTPAGWESRGEDKS